MAEQSPIPISLSILPTRGDIHKLASNLKAAGYTGAVHASVELVGPRENRIVDPTTGLVKNLQARAEIWEAGGVVYLKDDLNFYYDYPSWFRDCRFRASVSTYNRIYVDINGTWRLLGSLI